MVVICMQIWIGGHLQCYHVGHDGTQSCTLAHFVAYPRKCTTCPRRRRKFERRTLNQSMHGLHYLYSSISPCYIQYILPHSIMHFWAHRNGMPTSMFYTDVDQNWARG